MINIYYVIIIDMMINSNQSNSRYYVRFSVALYLKDIKTTMNFYKIH